MNKHLPLILLLLLALGLAGCAATGAPTLTMEQAVTQAAATAQVTLTAAVTATRAPSATPQATPTPPPPPTATLPPTPDTRPDPARWADWPVIPTVSGVSKQIYQYGLQNGNDPHIFSVVGDCQSEPNVFLGIYETDRFWLGTDFEYLRDTIAYYKGSFSRKSLGVRDGLSAPSALSPLWADKENCQANENPVQCELRVRKPAVMFINLGTNWKPGASAMKYEEYLRQVVQLVIQNGTLPILSTKADNVEGDNSLNEATARVAHDFDVPLFNFWRASSDMPNHGLDSARDNIYLTPDGWDRRNFTALMTLDAVRKVLGQ